MIDRKRLFRDAGDALTRGDLHVSAQLTREGLKASTPPYDDLYYETLHRAGLLAGMQGWTQHAITMFQDVIRARPAYAGGHYNIGVCQQRIGLLDEARGSLMTATSIRPDFVEAWCNRGYTAMAAGDLPMALHYFNKSLTFRPKTGDHAWVQAQVALLLGREGAWDLYEQRWKTPSFLAENKRQFTSPRWNGKRLGTKVILVHAEQGMGDIIQFASYCHTLRLQHPECVIVLEVQPPLYELFRDFPGADEVCAFRVGDPPPHDVHCPLGSLPYMLKSAAPGYQGHVWGPYLKPHGACPPHLRLQGTRPRIGFCWAGNQGHKNDTHRSLRTADITALIALVNHETGRAWDWYDVTKGREQAALTHLLGDTYHNMAPGIQSFNQSAHVLAQCDLVVTVDTAIVHLAGALGLPTILLNYAMSDWRWGWPEADIMPTCYQSVTQIRQARYGDWTKALALAAETIKEFSGLRAQT